MASRGADSAAEAVTRTSDGPAAAQQAFEPQTGSHSCKFLRLRRFIPCQSKFAVHAPGPGPAEYESLVAGAQDATIRVIRIFVAGARGPAHLKPTVKTFLIKYICEFLHCNERTLFCVTSAILSSDEQG